MQGRPHGGRSQRKLRTHRGTKVMSQGEYERLLTAMPEIAKVVNEFNSESVQRSAFAALVQAMGVTSGIEIGNNDHVVGSDLPAESTGMTGAAPTKTDSSAPARNGKRPRKAVSRRGPALVKDLDFRPDGKQPFREFVAEKSPETINERNLAAVYYLEQVMSVEGINAGHVLAAYRECSWREPGNLPQAIRDTAARKGWLDSSDGNNLSTTAGGRNVIVHDLPRSSS
jgi:hypothetical protein